MISKLEIQIDSVKARQSLALVYSHLSAFATFWLVLFFLPKGLGIGGLLLALSASFLTIWLLFYFLISPWFCKAQASRLHYWLENDALHADAGLIFYRKTSIPVARITDITLSQGPMQRIFGVWLMKVQTAGTGQKNPELFLHGVVDPEQTKALILSFSGANNGSTASSR